jgi:hypothetical protein
LYANANCFGCDHCEIGFNDPSFAQTLEPPLNGGGAQPDTLAQHLTRHAVVPLDEVKKLQVVAIQRWRGRAFLIQDLLGRSEIPMPALPGVDEFVHHLAHSFLGDVNDLVNLGAGRYERWCKAEDITVWHGARDQATVARGFRNTRAHL